MNSNETGENSELTSESQDCRVHVFDNSVRVFASHLTRNQLKRYERVNLHDADEEHIFVSSLRSVPLWGTYFSVGAGYGYYLLLAHSLRPDLSIHCYEPLSKHLGYIKENIYLNGYALTEFSLHSEAISCQTGKALFIDMNYGSHVLEEPVNTVPGWARFVTVDTIKLHDAVRQNGRVDLMQVDIQGHEEHVIAAFFDEQPCSRLIVTFLIATHDVGCHRYLETLLETNGYSVLYSDIRAEREVDGILFASLAALEKDDYAPDPNGFASCGSRELIDD